MGQWIKENWWVALAIPIGLMNTAAGIAAPFESEPWEGSLPWWITTPSMLTFGFLLLGGAWVRRRRRVAGDVMIAIGAVSVIPMFWTIILPILGVLIVVAALLDAVDASSVGDRDRSGTTRRSMDPILALLMAGLVAAGVASYLASDANVAAILVVPLVTATIAHIGAKRWAGGRPRMHAALALAGTPLLTVTLTGPALLLFGDPLELPQPLAGIVGGALVGIGIAGVLLLIVELRQTRARARPA